MRIKQNSERSNTCVILVNYNGSRDTIECLKSLLLSVTMPIHIVIVDNHSTDNSCTELVKWMESQKDTGTCHANICGFSSKTHTFSGVDNSVSGSVNIHLIKSDINLGFGGGNNLAIKFADIYLKPDYFWILNNDTVVHENALCHLVKRMDNDSTLMITASLLCFYSEKETVQATWSSFIPALGLGYHHDKNKPIESVNLKEYKKKRKRSYHLPATSLLIRKNALATLKGFDSSNFFMYGEDTDLIIRAKKAGLNYNLAPKSHVFHKKNTSTLKNRPLYYYYLTKSHVILIKKHFNIFFVFTSFFPQIAAALILSMSLKNTVSAVKGWGAGLAHKVVKDE